MGEKEQGVGEEFSQSSIKTFFQGTCRDRGGCGVREKGDRNGYPSANPKRNLSHQKGEGFRGSDLRFSKGRDWDRNKGSVADRRKVGKCRHTKHEFDKSFGGSKGKSRGLKIPPEGL